MQSLVVTYRQPRAPVAAMHYDVVGCAPYAVLEEGDRAAIVVTASPALTLVDADEAPEVLAASYDDNLVPERYRYAHHADFVRLAALIEYGGVYADIDALFLRPFPDELFSEPFVIGE